MSDNVDLAKMVTVDRTPGSEPRLMWESEHIRPLPERTRRAVSFPVIGVA